MLHDLLGIEKREMKTIGAWVLAYVFHRITQKELVALIDDKDKAGRVLSCVRKDGYVLKNCKLYAWAFYKSRHGDPKPNAKAFAVERTDALFLSKLNLNHLKLSFPALSLDEYDLKVLELIESDHIKTYIGKFVSRKMKFLLDSYGERRSDIYHDLEYAGLKALNMHYPRFESDVHYLTVAKAAIKNTGQTKISYHVSPCRQRLQKTASGAQEAVLSNIEDHVDIEAPKSSAHHIKETLEALIKVAIDRKMRPDVQQFIMCCAGHYDEGFSSFLGMNNDQAVEDMPYHRYLTKATKHFRFTDTQVQNLFSKLKTHIA
jgi:hypothetical protein